MLEIIVYSYAVDEESEKREYFELSTHVHCSSMHSNGLQNFDSQVHFIEKLTRKSCSIWLSPDLNKYDPIVSIFYNALLV